MTGGFGAFRKSAEKSAVRCWIRVRCCGLPDIVPLALISEMSNSSPFSSNGKRGLLKLMCGVVYTKAPLVVAPAIRFALRVTQTVPCAVWFFKMLMGEDVTVTVVFGGAGSDAAI